MFIIGMGVFLFIGLLLIAVTVVDVMEYVRRRKSRPPQG